ncbi:MAG: hypothetical protein ABI639_08650 [Thermoanaerobaculia bacterium]
MRSTVARPPYVKVLFALPFALGLSLASAPASARTTPCLKAVFFDLGDTLVVDTGGLNFAVREGAQETVDALQAAGLELGIITNVPADWTVETLRSHLLQPTFLDEFDVLTLSSLTSPPAAKPSPGIYSQAHAALPTPVPITATAFVGETISEIANSAVNPTAGARSVGMVGIHLSDAAPSALTDFTIPTNGLREVADIVANSCAVLGQHDVFVPSSSPASVKAFDLALTGNVAPKRQISGTATHLTVTFGTLVDMAHRELYVADFSANAIRVYSLTATGDVAPLREIVGAATTLVSPLGLALDSVTGDLFVKGLSTETVLVFPSQASGNVPPSRILTSGTPLGLNCRAVAVDAVHRELYVSSQQNDAIHVFPIGASGTTAPSRTISGNLTQLVSPNAMVIDLSDDELLVGISGGVLAFPRTQTGNAAPLRAIAIPGTFGAVSGLAFDPVPDELVVSGQSSSGHVLIYPRLATGLATALRNITGPATGLNNNAQLSIAPMPRFSDGFESGDESAWSSSAP